MKRTVALPALAVALMLAVAAAVVVSLSAGVPRASAYVLANGCDEYDPDRGITYRCTPDRSTFYTPDGVDPTRVYVGAGYGTFKAIGTVTINDTLGIPPPAPYKAGKDYCSEPWFGWSPFEGIWQPACYNHDVCYGSQLGRKYCDSRFWMDMAATCRANFGAWYALVAKYACLADARIWYQAVVWFGASHYKPRATSFEP
jgi:hypothetical protein